MKNLIQFCNDNRLYLINNEWIDTLPDYLNFYKSLNNFKVIFKLFLNEI